LVLVNDGSKDESLNICREYESLHGEIKVIDQQNAGASAARNVGLAAAKGKYITFVDSDDFVPNDYFDILDQTEDVDFVIYPYTRIIGNSMTSVDLPQSILTADSHFSRVTETVRNRFASPWNKRYKRVIIEENNIRFKRDLIIGEDFLFGLTYMLCCHTSGASDKSIYFADESLCTSVTRSSKYPSSQYLKIYEYAFPLVEQCSWDTGERERILQQIDYLYCRTAFVAAARLQSLKEKDCSLKELIHGFYNQSRWAIQPLNATHVAMKLCIKTRAIPVFWAVSTVFNFHK